MSIYKGDTVVATLNLHSANQSLNNLNPEGQGILDGKADSNLGNLSEAGTSRLLYSPFSINNGTRDPNGANATLHLFESSSSEDSQVNFEQNPNGQLFEENGDFNNPSPMAFKCTPLLLITVLNYMKHSTTLTYIQQVTRKMQNYWDLAHHLKEMLKFM